MALFRKFFYRKPPDGLLEISERVYVFDCCFTTDVLGEDEYKVYIGGIAGQLRDQFPDASFMVFNFRDGENQSLLCNILSEYDMTIMDYPRHYEGCALLTMEAIHHFLRSSESWLSLGQHNVLLMHCERGGWLVLAFMLAALLIYRKQYTEEHKTLDMIYKQAPRELLQLMSPLNPMPSQLRYLQYITRRNVGSEWPPLDRALTLDCIIIRFIPNMDGEGGCRPIFRIYGQDPFMAADRTPKVLFSTPKRSKLVRHYKQADCELVKIDIHCHIQGDVVLECISLDGDLEHEEMMFRIMFNTAFIRSNILMLNREDIDILWNVKDQFPKNFRAEVLFSEMDAASSLISIDLPGMEEKDGLPVEAFAKVQEIFSNVDWLDPKADVTHVLQKIASSGVLHKLDSASLHNVETGSLLLDSTPEKLKSEVKSSENDINSPTFMAQGKHDSASETANLLVESLPECRKTEPRASENSIKSPPYMALGKLSITNIQPSLDSGLIRKKIEPQDLQAALLHPTHSKIISQRARQGSLSAPVSFCNSLQGLPVPISRYQSAPSALGITALLQDHATYNREDQTDSLKLYLPHLVFSRTTTFSLQFSGLATVEKVSVATPPSPLPLELLQQTSNSPESLLNSTLKLNYRVKSVTSSSSDSKGSVSIPPPPAPPHFSGASPSSPVKNSISAPPPPPPPPSFSGSSPSLSAPLAPPPPSSFLGTSSSVKKSVSPPTPPPPPPSFPGNVILCQERQFQPHLPPPPPPFQEDHHHPQSIDPPLKLPLPLHSLVLLPQQSRPASTSTVTPSAPPPPPPPALAPKESLSQNAVPVPPVPPPPHSNGVSKSSGSPTSNSRDSNGNIPSIPGPPSGVPFSLKGRGPTRPSSRNQPQPKKANLKPYHWLKLTRAMHGSLWAEAQKADEATKPPEFDMKELESLFSAAAPNSENGNTGGKSEIYWFLQIELRRAYNCEIMLTKVKIPLPDLMSSVLALDDSALDIDQVENLIKFGYNGDKENLGKCEQFFLELMKVPRVEPKLRVFSFKIQFHTQVFDLRRNLNTVNSVADEIRSSEKLKRIMQTILSLGNALNHGTARGSAIGFRLDSLLKLTDTRARNNKMTLMHYLCKVLAEKLPELLDFPKDLVSLEASTKVQLKYLAEEMQAISKGLEKVVQELTASENDGPVSETFCKTLKEFLGHAEAEVRSLASLYSTVGRNADALALYFGEDLLVALVSTLFNFVKLFVRAHEENCKQLEFEKKKALKEAENEKMKAGNLSKKESELLIQNQYECQH
ncbi:formin-like protein 6 [Pyrus ussuriensis x Pyrus communis]|uniref:Formin-like protein n=1 Tax=Pyrus ussuriensis x Pyrus communis TaxID=2448454 RepID=A0A5N5HIV5_9ROSA|nr:formin-like protein 6 [Pyrus ussuriensis x Pyrus communis]